MKLWDVLATCLLLLSSVSSRPLFPNPRPLKSTSSSSSTSSSTSSSSSSESLSEEEREEAQNHKEQLRLHRTTMDEQNDVRSQYPSHLEDVMDFIESTIGRLRRSPEGGGDRRGRHRGAGDRDRGTLTRDRDRDRGDRDRDRGASTRDRDRGDRDRDRGASTRDRDRGHSDRRRGRSRARGGKANRANRDRDRDRDRDRVAVQGRGCLLKEVHLNVTDLGLGYQTKEELIFRYCSGPCVDAESNYDKILNNLTHNKKLDKDSPARTCCRPVAFDDDLSFLDDNVVYHTLKKHSARSCACV